MTGRQPVVATVGSIIVDLAFTTARVPRPGENILARAFRMGPGGKGANAAAAAARLGAVSLLVGCVGADDLAALEREALRREGVDLSGVGTDRQTQTGVALIMVDDQGENTILVAMGANASLTPEQALEALERQWERLDALLVNFEIPEGVIRAVTREAARRGVLAVVDAGPPRSYEPATWASATIITPNRSEIEALAGRSLATDRDLEEAARGILDRGPRAVVLKRGSRGAVVYCADGATEVAPFPVEVVDTTGAGDAFTAALTVGLAEGLGLAEAARRANAAGALAVTRLGTMPAMPTRREVDELLVRSSR